MSTKSEWKSRAIDQPEPGCFRTRLVRGGPWVAAQIRYCGGRWQAVIDGRAYPPSREPDEAVFRLWRSAEAIGHLEYQRMLQIKANAIRANANHPFASPTRPIVLTDEPSPF